MEGLDLEKNIHYLIISYQPDIDKIYLYAQDPYEATYQFLINKQESTNSTHFNDSKAFTEYCNATDDIYKNIEVYNPKKRKILIAFDDMICGMLSNKKRNPIETELFIGDKKLNISFVFITQSYFAAPKIVRQNSTHDFILKISNKQELPQTAFNHSSDIDFEDLLNVCKKCATKSYSFLVIDATLESDNPSYFRRIF